MKNKKETKKLQKKNFTKFGLDINPLVSILTAITIIMFIFCALFFTESFAGLIMDTQAAILDNFGWLFLLMANISIIVCFVLALSPIGKIRLGKPEDRPEYKRFSWWAMLFGAGMGIGIIFWGVAEPLFHYSYTPLFTTGNAEANSLASTYFHWGVHGWALYAISGLALAYYSFNKDLPFSPRSMFYPIIKDKIYGRIGDLIDACAAIITLFALSSSLGIGAMQVNAGLTFIFGVEYSTLIQVLIIIGITILASISVVSGVSKGIRILSENNIRIAAVLVVAIFLLGPTIYIIENILAAAALYTVGFIPTSIGVAGLEDSAWINSWTAFYMAWWISWTVFVGMFIARISRGRTIREFLLTVMLVPTVACIIWFGVLGSTAIYVDSISNGLLLEITSFDESLSLYAMIELLLTNEVLILILQILTLVLVLIFFITSSDSGSMVVDSLTSGGSIESPRGQKIFWASMEGLIACTILILGGSNGLALIETLLVVIAFPLAILLVFIIIGIIISLVKEYKKLKKDEKI